MSQIEYKTHHAAVQARSFEGDSSEITELLNQARAREHWRLSQIVLPSTVWGSVEHHGGDSRTRARLKPRER